MTERYYENNPKMNLIYNTLARAAEAERESESMCILQASSR